MGATVRLTYVIGEGQSPTRGAQPSPSPIQSQPSNLIEAQDPISPLTTRTSRPVEIFLSYARRDASDKHMLSLALGPYVQEGLIKLWDDGQLSGGTEWDPGIQRALSRAPVIVLLVSTRYFGSPNCLQEMEFAL